MANPNVIKELKNAIHNIKSSLEQAERSLAYYVDGKHSDSARVIADVNSSLAWGPPNAANCISRAIGMLGEPIEY